MSDDHRAGPDSRSAIPDGVAIKCVACKEVIFAREHERAGRICPHCQHPSPLTAGERVRFMTDGASFEPISQDAGVAGLASIGEVQCAVGAVDASAVGADPDIAARALGSLLERHMPTVLFCAGGVGAADAKPGPDRLRAHRALHEHGAARLPYVLVVTDPHAEHGLLTGAPLGDIVVAETPVRDMPAMTQPRLGETAEHPFIDVYVPRAEMKLELAKLLNFFAQSGDADGERQD
jgi:acetyl-CoA carboxylase carboxyl transferase subunit beta